MLRRLGACKLLRKLAMQVDPTTQVAHLPQDAPCVKDAGLGLEETATFMSGPLLSDWLTAVTESRLEEAKAEQDSARCYFVAYANAADFLLPLTVRCYILLNSLDLFELFWFLFVEFLGFVWHSG